MRKAKGLGFPLVAIPVERTPHIRKGISMLTAMGRYFWIACLFPSVLVISFYCTPLVLAQNTELQQKLAEVKQAAAANKLALSQYTWMEQVNIILKGEQKKQERFQVRLGPDGKPQKTSLDSPSPPPSSDNGRRRGRIREHVVEKKTEEYQEYADQIKSLIEQYVPPDRDMLERAFQQGNVTIGPQAGSPGQYRLVISQYIKRGDSMTLVVDAARKQITSLSIASYLDDPKDAVNVSVQFSQLPGGPNHVSEETINGVSKHLAIQIQNSNYQKL